MFTKINLIRGFEEIKELFHAIRPLGVNIIGGYARYCASTRKEPVPSNDVDLFCENESSYEKVFKFLTEIHSLTIEHENENCVCFGKPETGPFSKCPAIQLIKPHIVARMRTVGTPEEILENFDFTVTRAAIISETEVLVDEDFEKDEYMKKLRLKNIHCPISSTLRCVKYAKKGYSLPPKEAFKLFIDWETRDEEYRTKIKEFINKTEEFHIESERLRQEGKTEEEIKEQNKKGLSQKEIDEMEKMMMID